MDRKMNNFNEKVEAGDFLAGMKVMVVDNDQKSMTLQENVLTQFAYDVTACSQAKDALKLLREKKGSFDLIFVDVNIPDMDCCTLLKHIKEEMNLPSIMMLGDDNENISSIMEGITHGACDFLIKPMNKERVKNIWHHAARKKYTEKMELEGGGLKNKENGPSSNGATEEIAKKRSSSEDESTNGAITTKKRPRFVWTEERKQKFENAIKLIGIENVVPKTILQVMNDSEMTRENVSSHLQKYRSKLRRSEQNEAYHGQIEPDVRMSSSSMPPIPNQSPGQPIMLLSSQCPMQRSRSHLPLGQTMVFDRLTISQSNNSDYYRSNESIATPSNTRMNMQLYSTQSHPDVNMRHSHASTNGHHIPSTSYANNCNLHPRYFSNSMPIPQIPGGDVNDIGPLNGQPASGYLGGNVNNIGFLGGHTYSRQRQFENSSTIETSTVMQQPHHSTGLGFAGTEICNPVQVESNEHQASITGVVDEDTLFQQALAFSNGFNFDSYLQTGIPMIRQVPRRQSRQYP